MIDRADLRETLLIKCIASMYNDLVCVKELEYISKSQGTVTELDDVELDPKNIVGEEEGAIFFTDVDGITDWQIECDEQTYNSTLFVGFINEDDEVILITESNLNKLTNGHEFKNIGPLSAVTSKLHFWNDILSLYSMDEKMIKESRHTFIVAVATKDDLVE